MTSISIQEAGASLPELVRRLSPGEEILITENDQPVATITKAASPASTRQLGTMSGSVLHMSPDFDAPLDDFRE